MPTFRDLLNKAKAEITEIDTATAAQRIAAGGVTLLDVREPDEFDQGALAGVVYIPRGHLEAQVENRIPDKTAPIIAYCASGVRSVFAAKTLQDLGYTDVVHMVGGFGRWKDEGRAWTKPVVLTPEQRERYQRHLLLPEVGTEGQAKLLSSKVLLLGAGGLGSPAALYLAAAGVGTATGGGTTTGCARSAPDTKRAPAPTRMRAMFFFIMSIREYNDRADFTSIESILRLCRRG